MIIAIYSIRSIKGIDIRGDEISITLDMNDGVLNEVLYYVDENTNLSKNALDYLSENLTEFSNLQTLLKCCRLLIKNGYKIKLTDEDVLNVLNYVSTFDELIEFYNLLKSLNLLNKKYEEIIANKLASEIETSYKAFHLTDFKYELEEYLFRNNPDRELIEKAVKLFAQSFVREAIEDIPLWLRRPTHKGAFSYFLIFINVLKNFGLENTIKDEIEVLKYELKKYRNRIRRAVKNRIKKEENRDELKTLILILEDRSLYKYLL